MDLNCDLGESFGTWAIGDDLAILPFITSASIACGFHGGDWAVMDATVAACAAAGVAIGAHPSYPDLQGFGRRAMAIPAAEIQQLVLYQIGALAAFCSAHRVRLRYVKPHGALYHAAGDPAIADAIREAVARFDPGLPIVGPPGRGGVVAEAFADRAYRPDGMLVPRDSPAAVHRDPARAAAQAVAIASGAPFAAIDGTPITVRAATICLHGDSPGAARIAQAVRQALDSSGIPVRPFA